MSVHAGPLGPAVRGLLLQGSGSVASVADGLALRHRARAGMGISIFTAGTQLACKVSLQRPSPASLGRLLDGLRGSLSADQKDAVVLLSLLDRPRTVSIDEYRRNGVRRGDESVLAVHRAQPTVILAHVPCFLSWDTNHLAAALVRKQGATLPLELHLFPTHTLWIGAAGKEVPCRGGLPERRSMLDSAREIETEIERTANYLRGQLSNGADLAYAYDAWRDRAAERPSAARKAIALAALIGAARFLGDEQLERQASTALARIAARRPPVGDIDDAHLLLAGDGAGGGERAALLRDTIRSSGAIVGPDATDQLFFPGVVLAALTKRRALTPAAYALSLEHYRRRFRERPTWPALWWQLRAWSTVAAAVPRTGLDFAYELADWAIDRQLPAGAFDMDTVSGVPTFQTVCVAEALLAAAQAADADGSSRRRDTYVAAARDGLSFVSTLALGECHAEILPSRARAIGGIRTLHGELLLRSDVAGHYLGALVELAHRTGRA